MCEMGESALETELAGHTAPKTNRHELRGDLTPQNSFPKEAQLFFSPPPFCAKVTRALLACRGMLERPGRAEGVREEQWLSAPSTAHTCKEKEARLSEESSPRIWLHAGRGHEGQGFWEPTKGSPGAWGHRESPWLQRKPKRLRWQQILHHNGGKSRGCCTPAPSPKGLGRRHKRPGGRRGSNVRVLGPGTRSPCGGQPTLTHPEVVEPLGHGAVLRRDLRVEVLVETWLQGDELGQRGEVVGFL